MFIIKSKVCKFKVDLLYNMRLCMRAIDDIYYTVLFIFQILGFIIITFVIFIVACVNTTQRTATRRNATDMETGTNFIRFFILFCWSCKLSSYRLLFRIKERLRY